MLPSRVRFLPLFVLCAVGAVSGIEPPSGDLRFDHLGISDGLSNSSVSSIVQDETGFIWFGTQSGLNRYDGYSVERFEHDPFDRNSLSHNLIQTMHLDEAGVFWIGTYGGLNRFDPADGSFTRYANVLGDTRSLSNNVVVAIETDDDGRLWVGTLDGLNRLDRSDDRFDRYTADDRIGSLPNAVIRSLTLDRLGQLWIGTYAGLSRYVPEGDSFDTIGTDGPASERLPSPYVMSIALDPHDDEVLWLGIWDGGISRYDTRAGSIETIELPNDDVYTMSFDSDGRLWVGTWGGGLYIVDVQSGELRSIVAGEEGRTSGLAHNVVYSLLEDQSGIIWIGTNGGGVNSYVPWENRFQTFKHDPEDPQSIPEGKVDSVWVDSDDTVWIGTYTGGLSSLDPATGITRRYAHDPDDARSLSNDIVNAIVRDSRGTLWIGTNGGLNRFDSGTDRFERILAPERELLGDVIFAIHESGDGRLWLGTNSGGVVVYDPSNGENQQFLHDPHDRMSLSDNLVRCIMSDDHGAIWVGTNHGLNRYDPVRGGFVRYLHDVDNTASIPSNDVRAIYQDSTGMLWIATTGGGVASYNRANDEFSRISTRDGLASNHVVGILEDDSGRLWFATKRGVSAYSRETGEFRTLDVSSGLLSNELTQAVAKGPDGRLYLGGAGGVTVVDPDQDDAEGFAPPVVITRFEVLGQERQLAQSMDGTYETLELSHADKFFSVEYAALDYSTPGQNSYAYMLEGFDSEWQMVGSRNYAGYTNLAPGDYTLRIRGAGSRGNWNEVGVSVPIIVHPPWWQSLVARIVYSAIAVAILVWVYVTIGARQRRAHERISEQQRVNEELERKVAERTAEIEKARKTAEQATREKSLFLANMSHEIRTPLTGMTGMMSLLANTKLDDTQAKYLGYLSTSAENLTALVNDLLDFERIEFGELRLESDQFSIGETARYIEELFSPVAHEKGLDLTLEVDLGDDDTVLGDKSRVVQILTNLVSNAIKYTNEGSVGISVRLKRIAPQRVHCQFEVTDTGIGFNADEQALVFDRFRQLDNGYSKSGRGVGLGLAIVRQVVKAMGGDVQVESEKGVGSRFVVTLQLDAAAEPAATVAGGDDVAPIGPGEPRRDPKRLLLCEDEAINRLYLSTHLESLGYIVETASDGSRAVERTKEGDIDLVLMDLGMPGISGLEATEQIRDWELREQRPRTPIIALTAHSYPDDIERCNKAGMDGFVAKPIREADLHAAIAGLHVTEP